MDGLIETPARGSQFRESIELCKRLGAAWACGWELVKEKQTPGPEHRPLFATPSSHSLRVLQLGFKEGTSLLVASEPGSPLSVEARLNPPLNREI